MVLAASALTSAPSSPMETRTGCFLLLAFPRANSVGQMCSLRQNLRTTTSRSVCKAGLPLPHWPWIQPLLFPIYVVGS